MRGLLAALLLVFSVQYWCFRTYAEREIAWAYPGSYDQVFYLADSYTAHAKTVNMGLARGIVNHLAEKRPTGWLMPVEAALLYHVAGASRVSALTIHYVHLVMFELAFALTLYWLTGSALIALIGVGLYLCTLSRFLVTGGWMDFRMESSALSVFGIVLCGVIRSRLFLETRWAAATGAAAGYLICFRYITAAYLLPIFLLLAVTLLWRRRGGLIGLGIAALLMVAIAGPVLLYHQESIRGYYLPSHLVGGEKLIRAAEQGTMHWMDDLLFYPRVLLLRHLALWVFPAVALLLVATPLVYAKNRAGLDLLMILIPALAFLLVPIIVLTADTTKAEQVAGIMLPGLLWTLLVPLVRSTLPKPVLLGLAVIVLSGWLLREREWNGRHASFWSRRADVEQVVFLNARLARLAHAQGVASPLVTINEVVDYLSPDMLTVLAYEQTHQLVKPRSAIWLGVMAIPKENVLDGIHRSDFAILSTYPGPVPAPAYPFNVAMKEYEPDVLDAARREMHEAGEYRIEGRRVLLFSRR